MAAEMGVKAKAFWSGDSWKSFEFAKALEEAERYEDMVKVSWPSLYLNVI